VKVRGVSCQIEFKIVTSGYDDRILTRDTHYYVKGEGFTVSVSDHAELHELLVALGVPEKDISTLTDSATKNARRSMAGWISPTEWRSLSVCQEEIGAVAAYLGLKRRWRRSRFSQRYLQDRYQYLVAHPLSDELRAIVEYHLAECDRQNVFHWGHPDGLAFRFPE